MKFFMISSFMIKNGMGIISKIIMNLKFHWSFFPEKSAWFTSMCSEGIFLRGLVRSGEFDCIDWLIWKGLVLSLLMVFLYWGYPPSSIMTTKYIIVKSTPHMTPTSPPSLKLWEPLQQSFPQPAKGWGSVGERMIIGKREYCRFFFA